MPNISHEALEHGHSDMIHLLDDVQAHANSLGEPIDDVILDGLGHYLTKFAAALRGHIAEEETEVFPQLQGPASEAVDKLKRQHCALLQWLNLVEQLAATVDQGKAEELQSTIKLLRRDFSAHSADERGIIRQSETYGARHSKI